MASCPSCRTQVDVDFGMATCPNANCRLVFMVGIDGVGTMPEEQNYDEASYETAESDSSGTSNEGGEVGATYVGTDTPPDDPVFQTEEAEVYGDGSMGGTEFVSNEPTEIHQAGESNYNEDFLSNMNDPEPEPETIIPDDGPRDPLGVQKFDRTEASQLIDGPYYYDLFINGLDTAQIKDEVMRALTDKRFQWGVEDIRKKLRNGRLVFKDLNPVKAVLIVIKLQHIDVEIEWIQKLHTDPSVSGGVPGQA